MGYEVVLHLYEREVGLQPEKICGSHVFAEKHGVLKNSRRNELYSYNSFVWGTVQCTDTSGNF